MTMVITGLDIEEKAAWAADELFGILGGRDQFDDVRRPAAALRPPGRAGQRAGDGAPAGHGEGPRRAEGRPPFLQRHDGAGARRVRRVPHHDAARGGERVRGVLARACAGRGGGAHRGTAGRHARRHPRHAGNSGAGLGNQALVGSVPSVAHRNRRAAARGREAPACALRLAGCARPVPATRAATPTSGCGPATRPGTPGCADYLTTERLRSLLPEAAGPAGPRYELPNLHALNFVMHRPARRGGVVPTRPDPQAKGLGEYLRSRLVPVPVGLLQ